MEDLLHLVLVESLIPQQIPIFAAWTAFVNLTSSAQHVLLKLIIITHYIKLRYAILPHLPTINHHDFIIHSFSLAMEWDLF